MLIGGEGEEGMCGRALGCGSGTRELPLVSPGFLAAGLQLAHETGSCGHGLRARRPSGPSHAVNVATGTKDTMYP